MVGKSPGTTLEDPVAADWRPDLEKSAHDINEYLEEQDAYLLFDGILKELATQQPEDPIQHLLDYLQAGHPFAGPLRVIVIRPPGLGASDQVSQLAKFFGLAYISASQVLKDNKFDATSNELADDKAVSELVVGRITKAAARQQGFVVEGFPRTRVQTTYLQESCVAPSHVLLLKGTWDMILAKAGGADATELPPHMDRKYRTYYAHLPSALETYKAADKITVIDCAALPKERDALFSAMVDAVKVQAHSKGPKLPHRIVMLGPRGVGVKEHSTRLAARLGAVLVDGAALVAAAAMPKSKRALKSPLQGEQRLELTGMDLPNLEALSAEDQLGLVGVRLRQPDCTRKGWVLFDFPTTEDIATHFAADEFLSPLRVVVLQASEETCVSRLRDRYVDYVTGEVWDSMPQERYVRNRLRRNPDDQPEAVAASYKAYSDSIDSVLNALESGLKARRVFEIPADGQPDAVFKEICEFVERPLPLPEPEEDD